MPTSLASGQYLAQNANLAKSEFRDVNLSESKFADVSLSGAKFDDVSLKGAVFHDVALINVTIENANYEGMRIDGILVTELLRVYRERNHQG